MKNVLISSLAPMLVIWYSLSVIGFDIHTCSGSGETYVATVITGTACEDIHPEHVHPGCSCCHHGHDENHKKEDLRTKSCCTDQWQVIVLTGVPTDDNESFCTECSHASELFSDALSGSLHASGADGALRTGHRYKSRPQSIPKRNLQSEYNIWRI